MFRDGQQHLQKPADPQPECIALQKLLQGYRRWSRDELRALIQAGRVEVDGEVVTRFAHEVPPHCTVLVDGEEPRHEQARVFIMNKPRAHITARDAAQGHPGLGQYLPDHSDNLFAVGRLDAASEGALLWTNDGQLARRILHPDFGMVKRYAVKLRDRMEPNDPRFSLLTRGFEDRGVLYRALFVRFRELRTRATWIEIQLDEGKNREIRRMCVAAGFQIVKLRREAIGPVEMGTLNPRCVRELRGYELPMLYRHVGLSWEAGCERPARPVD
jgi:pseudouridine synthase